MATYAGVNGTWPDDLKVPTPREAIAGAKRLVKVAYRHAIDEGAFRGTPMKRRFKLTSGNRYTYIRGGVWYVNPNGRHFGGWRDIVHGISHWAGRRFWPSEPPHSPRHVWIEKLLVDYAVKHLIAGCHVRPIKAKPPVDHIAKRAARVRASIKRWESKKRRAETALRKLKQKERYYARRPTHNPRLPATGAGDTDDRSALAFAV